MAGQIVQAIIVPADGNIEALKEVLGEDFSKIDGAEVSKDGGSTVYTLAQKSEFVKTEKVSVGDTNIQIEFGEPRFVAKADAIVMPLQTTAATITDEHNITYAELLSKAFYNTEDIIWGAFRQPFSSEEMRSQIVLGAWDAFRATLLTILAQTASTTISGKAEKREPPAYGMADLATRLVAEMKKSEKRLLQRWNAEHINTETPDLSGKTEVRDMTKEEMQELLAPITDGLAAVKADVDALKTKEPPVVEPPTAEVPPVVPAAEKSEGLTAEAMTEAIKAAQAPLLEEIATLKTTVTETAEKTEALQHAGRGHIDVEALAKKHENDPRLKSAVNKYFVKRWGIL